MCLSFASFESFAVRFNPHHTDNDTITLAQSYKTVGLVEEHKKEFIEATDDLPAYTLSYTFDSTATLITLPGLEEYNGRLVIGTGHGLTNWDDNSLTNNFTFTLNNQTTNIINVIFPSEIVLKKGFACFSQYHPFQMDICFMILETAIDGVEPSPLYLEAFKDLPSHETFTTVGFGYAGRMDVGVAFSDRNKRAMQTKVSEHKPAILENNITAIYQKNPLRLQHSYPALTEPKSDLIRGSIANIDSGGPVFININDVSYVVGILKGSIIQTHIHQAIPNLKTTREPNAIQKLKENTPWVCSQDLNLELNTDNLGLNYVTTDNGFILEYLGGIKNWITRTLPVMLENSRQ